MASTPTKQSTLAWSFRRGSTESLEVEKLEDENTPTKFAEGSPFKKQKSAWSPNQFRAFQDEIEAARQSETETERQSETDRGSETETERERGRDASVGYVPGVLEHADVEVRVPEPPRPLVDGRDCSEGNLRVELVR